MDKIKLVAELADEIRACTGCVLAKTRTQAVPGVGTATAKLMFVGEGPGEKEDLKGEPFVGVSGQLLTRELAAIGIEREHVFITNIVKCRPPGNRVPALDEIAACNDWLMAQIALIEPTLIVTVGGPSLNTLVSPALKITKARLHVYRKDGILFSPILHPSAALRSGATMELFREDIRNLKRLLEEGIPESDITDLGSAFAAPPAPPAPVPRNPAPKNFDWPMPKVELAVRAETDSQETEVTPPVEESKGGNLTLF